MIRSLGRRCRGDLWSPAVIGIPPVAGLPGRGTAFFPKESGGKERARGSFMRWLRVDFHRRCPRHLRLPVLPKRGPMAAGCTNQAKTGRASTPGSFFCSFQALPRPGRPAATQRSGRRGERRHSERLRRHTARRAGACPRRPFRIRRRAGCAGNDKGRTPAPDVRPSSKERGYNEMKRNCLLRV